MAMLNKQKVSSLIRLETKPDGTKLLMPIRPIACVSGIMDLGHAVIRMVWAVDFAAELMLRLLIWCGGAGLKRNYMMIFDDTRKIIQTRFYHISSKAVGSSIYFVLCAPQLWLALLVTAGARILTFVSKEIIASGPLKQIILKSSKPPRTLEKETGVVLQKRSRHLALPERFNLGNTWIQKWSLSIIQQLGHSPVIQPYNYVCTLCALFCTHLSYF